MKYDILKSGFGRKVSRRIVVNLLNLKEGLEKAVPPKTNNGNLLLATWNLHEFDSNRAGHGHRLPESFLYIGEILSAFDLIVLQEVDEDLSPLERLLFTMGSNWDYIATEAGRGTRHGERMAFVYDCNRVVFERMTGAMTLPDNILGNDGIRFVQPPFTATFRTGEIRFNICPVHLDRTTDGIDDLSKIPGKVNVMVRFIRERMERNNENGVLVGDFTEQNPYFQTIKALMDNGFTVPEQIRQRLSGSNKFTVAHHDQMAIAERKRELEYAGNDNSAGVFDYYEYVFREGDYYPYTIYLDPGKVGKNKNGETTEKEIEAYFSDVWRTWQMSDHLPLWVEMKVDFSMEFLIDLIR